MTFDKRPAFGIVALFLFALDSIGAQEIEGLRKLEGHEETAYDIAFSPNSQLLATGSFDKSVKLWKVGDGTLLSTLSGHTGKVLSVAFSPGGDLLASGSEDKSIKLWAMPSSGPDRFDGHSGKVHALALSGDGAWLASAAADKTVIVWERGSRKPLVTIKDIGASTISLAFDARQARLAGGCDDGTVRVWTLPVPDSVVSSSAGSADTSLIANGEPWRYRKGTEAPPGDWKKVEHDDSSWTLGDSGFGYSSNAAELATVKTKLDDMPQKQYLSVFVRKDFTLDDPKRIEKLTLKILVDDAFVAYLNGEEVGRQNIQGDSPAHNATAAAATEPSEQTVDLTPHLGKLRKGKNVLAIQGHNANTSSSDFILTPSLSAVVKAAEKPAPKKVDAGTQLAKLEGVGAPVRAVSFSPDGATLSAGGENGAVRVFPLGGGDATKIDGSGPVSGIVALDDKTVAIARGDGSIRIASIDPVKEQRKIESNQGAVRAIAYHAPSKTLASAGEDATARLWNVDSGQELRKIDGHESPLTSIAFSADGKTLVTGSADKSLRVWKVENGANVTRFDQGSEILDVAVSNDERYYSAGESAVLGWRVEAEGELRTLSGHGQLVYAVAFSPDGQTIASGSADKSVRIWETASGKSTRTINAHEASVYCVAFSPDGSTLASGGYDKTVKLWNPRDGKEVKKLEGHEEGVFALAFAADGKTLVSASSDHTLRVWNLETGESLQTLSGHPGWIMDVAVLDGGKRIVSADYGGHIFAWGAESGEKTLERRAGITVHGFAAAPNGAWFATANSDGSVFLFPLPKSQ